MRGNSYDNLYRSIWETDPNYGTAVEWVQDTVDHRIGPFMARSGIRKPCTAIDLGAGDGRYLKYMHECGLIYAGIGVDFYRPDTVPPRIAWVAAGMDDTSLALNDDYRCDFVISTDALEHVAPDELPQSLANMRHLAAHGWARISLIPDPYGKTRGLPELHLCLFSTEEWLNRLRAAGMQIREYRLYFEGSSERALEVGW
jgi:hypothetical protein